MRWGSGRGRDVPLADAREAATEYRRLKSQGIDPLAQRRADRAQRAIEAAKALTFKDCAERYIEAHRDGWRNAKHAEQWPATLKAYVYPTIGALPISTIDTALVLKTLEPIWSSRPETASRVRNRIELVLDWARARGYRAGENPARWRGHLDHLLPARGKIQKVKHFAALPYSEMAGFVADLRSEGHIAARALEFVVLTACRSGEVLNARWDEIDTSANVWVIPADRMKAGQEHRVPLSPAALVVLKKMRARKVSAFVFPGAKKDQPLGNAAMLQQLKRMDRKVTAHGMRSTFRTWCAERTSFPREVCELALAHNIAGSVERAYQRTDHLEARRRLMDQWAQFCSAEPTGANVTPIRGVA